MAPVMSPEHGGMEGNGPGEARKALEESGCWPPCPPCLERQPGRMVVFLAQAQVCRFLSPSQDFLLAGLWDCSLPAPAVSLAPLHPPKLCIRGQGRVGKTCSSQPCLISSTLPPPPTSALLGPQNVLLQSWTASSSPCAPKGFRKVGVSLSGGQLSGRGGRADGEEPCRLGNNWGDGDISG